MDKTYSFGVPGPAIWLGHIFMGILLFYVGYSLLNGKEIPQWIIIMFLILGPSAILYHAHLFYHNYKNE
jgi:hypothetical protein